MISKDFDNCEEILLLAEFEERGSLVHHKVFGLSTGKSRVQASRWFIATESDSGMEMGGHFHGFHHMFTEDI